MFPTALIGQLAMAGLVEVGTWASDMYSTTLAEP